MRTREFCRQKWGTAQPAINPNSVACVPVTCDTATAKEGGKIGDSQDVDFTPHGKYKSVPFDGMALHDVSINVSCTADSYAVYQFKSATDQFDNPACKGMCMQVGKCLCFGRTRVCVRCACTRSMRTSADTKNIARIRCCMRRTSQQNREQVRRCSRR